MPTPTAWTDRASQLLLQEQTRGAPMTDTAASSAVGVSVDRPVHNHAPYHPVCKESLIGDCLRQPSLDREAVRLLRAWVDSWAGAATNWPRNELADRTEVFLAAHPEAGRGEERDDD